MSSANLFVIVLLDDVLSAVKLNICVTLLTSLDHLVVHVPCRIYQMFPRLRWTLLQAFDLSATIVLVSWQLPRWDFLLTFATSIKSSTSTNGFPSHARWTVMATYALWFEEVQASVAKLSSLLYSFVQYINFHHCWSICVLTCNNLAMRFHVSMNMSRTSCETVVGCGK